MISFKFRITDPRGPIVGFFAVLGPLGNYGYFHDNPLAVDEVGLDLVHVWAVALGGALVALKDGKNYFVRDPDSETAGLVFLCSEGTEAEVVVANFSGLGKNSGDLSSAAPWEREQEVWKGPCVDLLEKLRRDLNAYLRDAKKQVDAAEVHDLEALLTGESERSPTGAV